MPLFRNAFYWFIALLGIQVLGFWNSYFSILGTGKIHWTHHFHGTVMVGWVLLLTIQSWLIRNRRNAQHRAIGKLSFLLAPAVVVSAIAVNNHSVTIAPDPLDPEFMGIFQLGYFSAGIFALMYGMAIHHRRRMQLHARYMVATALIFLNPGLVRAVYNYIAPLGVWVPSFYQFFFVPMLIGLWLAWRDWRTGAPYRPFSLFTLIWGVDMVVWKLVPHWSWFQAFTEAMAAR